MKFSIYLNRRVFVMLEELRNVPVIYYFIFIYLFIIIIIIIIIIIFFFFFFFWGGGWGGGSVFEWLKLSVILRLLEAYFEITMVRL